MKILSRLQVLAEEPELLKTSDFEIYKNQYGYYEVKRKNDKVPYIGMIPSSRSYMDAYNKLGRKIYDYNTKNIVKIRSSMISKLHRLFKAAGMEKSKDMTSRIRGYRPIVNTGYLIDTYAGDRTSFNISFTSEKKGKEYAPKVQKILDKEGIKYEKDGDYFTIDLRAQ